MQKPMGEDVAAFGVGAKLYFVHCHEFDLALERHRFNSADEIPRIGGNDLLLAGDERHARGATYLDNPVVNFARKQPQRQADHSARMG